MWEYGPQRALAPWLHLLRLLTCGCCCCSCCCRKASCAGWARRWQGSRRRRCRPLLGALVTACRRRSRVPLRWQRGSTSKTYWPATSTCTLETAQVQLSAHHCVQQACWHVYLPVLLPPGVACQTDGCARICMLTLRLPPCPCFPSARRLCCKFGGKVPVSGCGGGQRCGARGGTDGSVPGERHNLASQHAAGEPLLGFVSCCALCSSACTSPV